MRTKLFMLLAVLLIAASPIYAADGAGGSRRKGGVQIVRQGEKCADDLLRLQAVGRAGQRGLVGHVAGVIEHGRAERRRFVGIEPDAVIAGAGRRGGWRS